MRIERVAAVMAVTLVLTACAVSSSPTTGRELASDTGCLSCHSDQNTDMAPTWQGLSGATVRLEDGTTVVADGDYIRRSITDPAAQVVEGYRPIMPSFELTEQELELLVEHIESLGP